MRPRRPLGATYGGLLLLGLSGGLGFALTSAAMFLYRQQAEPIVRVVLPFLVPKRGVYSYDPDEYYLWASLLGFLAVLWAGLIIYAAVRKPAEDKRIEEALKARLRQASRGAPLEP